MTSPSDADPNPATAVYATATPADAAPLVSVIIPSYNNARFLPQTLDSVLNQSYTNIEILVIDDGSTDDTAAVIAPYLAACADRLRYIHKPNGGPSSARNLGIRQSSGTLVAFQDADDLWFRDKLARQVQLLKARPDVGVVFTDIAVFDDNGGFIHRTIKEDYPQVPSGFIFDDLLTGRFIATSAVVVRRACLDRVGGFDESLIGAEDYNLYLRLARLYAFAYLDEVLVHKRAHSENLSENLEQMCHDAILNLHKIAALFPDATIDQRKLAAQLYLRFGKYHFSLQRYAQARRCFQQALAQTPASPDALGFFLVCSLPHRVIQSLLAVKRRFRRAAAPAGINPPARVESSGD